MENCWSNYDPKTWYESQWSGIILASLIIADHVEAVWETDT
jgi:hypothetical protein